jgi:hypothetical protein
VLDAWKDIETGLPSAFRVTSPTGAVVTLQIDRFGRPTFLQDSSGTKIWIVNYDPIGEAEIILESRAGQTWRAIVRVPEIGEASNGAVSRDGPASKSASASSYLQVASRVCPTVTSTIGYISDAFCYYGVAAAMVAAPPAGALALLSCAGKSIVEGLISLAICKLLNEAALIAASNVASDLPLGEPRAPIPTRPSVPINERPPAPIARDDAYMAIRGQDFVVPAPGVLANDMIPAGFNVTGVDFFSWPPELTWTNTGAGGFTLHLSRNHSITGPIAMRYVIWGRAGPSSAQATVNIMIR